MNCPECGFPNREGAKFCSECGFHFVLRCSACGAEHRPQANFCDRCGICLIPASDPRPEAPSLEEKLQRIQRYLPSDLVGKILSQKDRLDGERREVTIMFCDMKAFTSLAAKLGPDRTFSLMGQVFEILIQKVNDYQGTVNELRGDGILAFFGAPIALEDAPQRAIRAALAIHREMIRFNERIKLEKEIPPVLLRIGINTGPVVVGSLGTDLRAQFTAVGDTINLASRMESLAEPGTIYITEGTFRLTEGFFRFEALGEKTVKGMQKPVPVYRVIAPSSRRTRFDVSAERGLAPFVGRKRELDFMLSLFERVKSGSGQALSIVSEAGMGKSRLLYEFRKAMIHQDVTFLEGRCLSYSRRVVYHPIIDILRAAFGIQEGVGSADIREKALSGLKALGADDALTSPFLLEILSAKNSGVDRAVMSPEARKERIMEGLKRVVLKSAERRPLILAVEDLHWIDQSSEDAFKDLLANISGSRVFLLLTCRPEYRVAWGGSPYHSQITLDRLALPESRKIIHHLVDSEVFDTDIEELIYQKTDGIPLFIEEYMRSFQGLRIIEKKAGGYSLTKSLLDIAIPSTLQEIIMARVDALPEGAKEVIQAGAAIEREFSHGLIREVMGLGEKELHGHLSALKEAGLVYERGIYPESFYIFNHAVTQEVIYDSILTKKKRRLHERIGKAIESLYADTLELYVATLARHYGESGNLEKGAQYSLLAAKKSENQASFPDAIAFGAKRVACLDELSRVKDVDRQLIDARTTLGLYYIQMNYHEEAKRVVEAILPLAQKQQYQKRLAQIYTIIGSYHFIVEEDYEKGIEQLQQALKIANETGDILCLFLANFWLGFAFVFTCDFKPALNHWQQALEINSAAKSLWGVSVVKSAMVWAHSKQGNIALSHQTSKEAMQLAEESQDIFSQAYAFGGRGISLFHKGFLDAAEDSLQEGVRLCDRIKYFSMGSLFCGYLGDIQYHRGDYGASITSYQKAVDLARSSKFVPSLTTVYQLSILKSKIARKDLVEMEDVYEFAQRNKLRISDGIVAHHVADILLIKDPTPAEAAEAWITKAIQFDEKNDMRWYLGQDHLLAGTYWKRRQDPGKADKHWRKAEKIFQECGSEGWVEHVRRQVGTYS